MTKRRSVLMILLIMLMCVALVLAGCQNAADHDDNDGKNETEETGTTETSNPEDNGIIFEDPNDQVENSVAKTFAAAIETSAIESVLGEAIKGGKITVEVANMIKNELYLDVLGNEYADFLTVSYDAEVYSEFGFYLKDSKLAVSAPVLLGDEVYGIDFNTLGTDLENCELWAMMGTTYEEFQAQAGIDIDGLKEAVEKYVDAVSNAGDSMADSLKNVEVTREKGTVVINGETVDAVNVKYHLTSEDFKAVMNAYLDEYEKSMEAMTDAFADVFAGMDMDEMMSEMDMDTMRQELDTAFASVDLEGDLVVSINPDSQYIMNVSMDIAGTIDGEEGQIEMDLVLGVDPTSSEKYTFSLSACGKDTNEVNGITIDVVRATNGSVETSTLTISEVSSGVSAVVMTAELSHDSSNGAYEISMAADGETVSIKGIYLVSADKLEISVDTVTSAFEGEEYTETIGLRLCVETISKSEMPAMPNMKNILKLTQDEWTELLNKFVTEDPDDYYDEDFDYDEDIYTDEDYFYIEDAA